MKRATGIDKDKLNSLSKEKLIELVYGLIERLEDDYCPIDWFMPDDLIVWGEYEEKERTRKPLILSMEEIDQMLKKAYSDIIK